MVIARSPCLVDRSVRRPERSQASVDEAACTGCQLCSLQFECPALVYDEEQKRVVIDTLICTDCGVCVDVCPRMAIEEVGQ